MQKYDHIKERSSNEIEIRFLHDTFQIEITFVLFATYH